MELILTNGMEHKSREQLRAASPDVRAQRSTRSTRWPPMARRTTSCRGRAPTRAQRCGRHCARRKAIAGAINPVSKNRRSY